MNEIENLLYNITWLRKNNKLSKNKMAEILGVGVKSIDKIEKGVLPPKFGTESIVNISRFFNIFIDRLFREKFQ